MKRRPINKQTYKEDSDSEDSFEFSDIEYFIIRSGTLIDVGDGWAAVAISYPKYDIKHGFIVNCIISKTYERLMTLDFVLNHPDIVVQYVKYMKSQYSNINNEIRQQLEQCISAAKCLVKSPFRKGDVLLYTDPPEEVEKYNARLVIVSNTLEIKQYKCLSEFCLTTEIKHLNGSLDIPELAFHSICTKKGTLETNVLKLLLSAKEIRKIGQMASKYKAVAMLNEAKLQEITERYNVKSNTYDT